MRKRNNIQIQREHRTLGVYKMRKQNNQKRSQRNNDRTRTQRTRLLISYWFLAIAFILAILMFVGESEYCCTNYCAGCWGWEMWLITCIRPHYIIALLLVITGRIIAQIIWRIQDARKKHKKVQMEM